MCTVQGLLSIQIEKAHRALVDNYGNARTNFGSYLNKMQRSAICQWFYARLKGWFRVTKEADLKDRTVSQIGFRMTLAALNRKTREAQARRGSRQKKKRNAFPGKDDNSENETNGSHQRTSPFSLHALLEEGLAHKHPTFFYSISRKLFVRIFAKPHADSN